MCYLQLFNELEKYRRLSVGEKEQIKMYFQPVEAKKKQVLILRKKLCDKLFFVNHGMLRTYYMNEEGAQATRRFAWEGRFLTNMESFRKNGMDNNETIECIEEAQILQITKGDLDKVLSNSKGLANIYYTLLEEYLAVNIKHYSHISQANPLERLVYFHQNYPKLKNRLSDELLASFLIMSRRTLLRTKKEYSKV